MALLLEPEKDASVRDLARELGRVSRHGLRGAQGVASPRTRRRGQPSGRNRVVLARRRSLVDPQTYVARLPDPGDPSTTALRVGLNDETGWSTVGSVPASGYGAPVVAREDQIVEFYVPDAATVRRAVTLLGVAPTAASAKASIRVAPVPAVLAHRKKPEGRGMTWPAAHPLFVALDLAQDQERGREILDAWTPTEGVRVW